MTTITTLTTAIAIAILAAPSMAAQKARPNLSLNQAMPRMTAAAKPKPKPNGSPTMMAFTVMGKHY